MKIGLGIGLGFSRASGGAPAPLWVVDFSGVTPGALTASALLALGGGGLVLTRASSATVQDSASTVVITGIGVDVPRVADLGVAGKRGLRVEEARTNAISYARDVSQSGGLNWAAFAGATRTGGQVGIDGTSNAYRIDAPSGGGLGENTGSNPNAGPTTVSAWLRSTSGTAAPNLNMFRTIGTRIAIPTTVGTTYQRVALTAATTSETVSLVPIDGRDWTTIGGVGAGARAFVIDGAQREIGAFPSSLIVTAGASATRAGERLRHGTPANLLSSGRLSLELALCPSGASTEYAANVRVWTIDASNYAEVDKTTRVLTVVIGGVSRTLGALPTWARDDKLEIYLAAGGGSATTVAKVRKNGGTITDLGSAAAQAAISPGGNALDVLCSGTASQFTGLVSYLAAHPANGGPAWAA